MEDIRKLREALERSLDLLTQSMINEWRAQGHVASGRSVRSIESRVTDNVRSLAVGEVLIEEYMRYQDTGTKPHRPPFAAILRWVRDIKPGLSEEASREFAWRVVSSIEQVGTPSAGSYAYSRNGRRREWSKYAALEAEGGIRRIFEQAGWIEALIEGMLRREGVLQRS